MFIYRLRWASIPFVKVIVQLENVAVTVIGAVAVFLLKTQICIAYFFIY